MTVESLWRQTLYPGETAEERQVREERERQEQRERQVQRQAAAAERRAADERAEALLSESLDPIQLAEYRDRGHFHVQVSSADGPRRYRIERGWVQNVRLVDRAGRVRRTYCIHPAEQIPIADSLLAQKLLLEADEDTFLALANAS